MQVISSWSILSLNSQAHKLVQSKCEREHKMLMDAKKKDSLKKISVSSKPEKMIFPQALACVTFQRPKQSFGSTDNRVKVRISSCVTMKVISVLVVIVLY